MRRARWKRKNVRRVGLRQRRPPAAGGGRLAVPCGSQGRKRAVLGESFGPGKLGIHPASLFAAAGGWSMKVAAWVNATVSTTARAARSEAERAERGAGQMRPCTPTQDAPAPRESAFKSIPHPAAPVGKSSQTRRHHLTPTPVQQLCTHVQSCDQKRFFLFHRARRILFLSRTKREWGAHPPWKRPPGGSQIPRPMGRTINQR